MKEERRKNKNKMSSINFIYILYIYINIYNIYITIFADSKTLILSSFKFQISVQKCLFLNKVDSILLLFLTFEFPYWLSWLSGSMFVDCFSWLRWRFPRESLLLTEFVDFRSELLSSYWIRWLWKNMKTHSGLPCGREQTARDNNSTRCCGWLRRGICARQQLYE